MSHQELIRKSLLESIRAKEEILASEEKLNEIERSASIFIETLRKGGKIMLCGNGGSAADAQHIAAELSGRFKLDRPPLPVMALAANASLLTAVANDYGYEEVFARQVAAFGRPKDLLVAISTSGDSPNILTAVEEAQRIGMEILALTGANGGALAKAVDHCIRVPSDDTARIQEAHICIGHILCEITEDSIFGKA